MLDNPPLTAPLLRAMFADVAAVMQAQAEYLTDLDRPIGDADHGRNMALGFAEVCDEIEALPPGPPAVVLRVAGQVLLTGVGGAAGPLYSTAFIAAALA